MSAGPDMSGVLSRETVALVERVLAELGPLPDPTTLPPTEGRALSLFANARCNVDLPSMQGVSEVWVEEDAELGATRCRLKVLVPPGAAEGAILFVHGGGFAFCSPETHERCARVLAIESGMPVVLPDYRLAPEDPFPAGLKDVVSALRSMFDVTASAGISRGPLLISGDSAGANLALAAMLHELAADHALPDGALLFYGNYARSFETPSYIRFSEGPGLTRAKMQRYWSFYAGEQAIEVHPLACPLLACDDALAALPQLHLMAAAVDPLLSDTLMLSERLKALGRDDELSIVPGVMHGFLQNTYELSAAREALAAAGRAARRLTGRI
ncbi:alpha/beta hydrolase [Shinella sp.]|uniref:alpha/beta hydrolase n=1 Tax=Shinella sp. TaxID=1870904 RepID=UPI0028A24AC3|nr:alpha/beta hydrolase [Shinella sp.]